MASVAGINILSDKKAKILTALKASLRASESVISQDMAKKAKKFITDENFGKAYDACGDSLCQDTAIVLYDDYITLYYEDMDLDVLEQNAVGYAEVFEKPIVYTMLIDEELLILGVVYNGKIVTRRIFGACAEEYDLAETPINMDYLSHIYNDKHLTDLNTLSDLSDFLFTLEEDYGLYAEESPLTIPLFEDRYKLLEKSETFSVYSTL